MNCREVQRILTEEIELAESADVRKHLDVCRECRDLHRDLLSLQALSGGLRGRTSVPAYFTERVCSRVSGRSRVGYWSVAAATAAGLVFLGVGIVNLAGPAAESDREVTSRALNGGEQIRKIESDDRAADVSHGAEPDVFYLGGEGWGSRPSGRLTVRSHSGVPLVKPESSSSGYVLELPAAIEVRQTQADNEFYLENVSH